MTLIIQKPTGAKLVLRKTWQPMDPDAAAYIAAVETADGEALEEKTKIAIDNFVLGCKADGIWSAIKASCILAGARTLDGALVPLVGTAPTNVGGLFVSGDYNRKTGLKGDGASKYLDANYNNNLNIQNNRHLSVYGTEKATLASTTLAGVSGSISGRARLRLSGANSLLTNCGDNTNITSTNAYLIGTGLLGVSRNNGSDYLLRNNSVDILRSASSVSPNSASSFVFTEVADSLWTNARLAFYSIGESLDLALLDARVTDLINAFAAAIP